MGVFHYVPPSVLKESLNNCIHPYPICVGASVGLDVLVGYRVQVNVTI